MNGGIGQVRANRRIVFHGLGALGVAAALAGCAGGDEGGGDEEVGSGTELTTTDQVPVGGGTVLTDHKIVVTQPTKGEFRAYTAVCSHQQLTVTGVADGEIQCDHHGSRYDVASGEVVQGPAPSPLAAVDITVDGDRILKA